MTMKRTLCVLFAMVVLIVAGCNRPSTASRSDADVANDVQAKINNDSAITNKGIAVNSTNGTVTLSGNVANETERIAAANDASSVNGVKTVVNNLTVGGAQSPMASSEPEPSYSAPAAPSRSTSSSTRRATSTRGSAATSMPSNASSGLDNTASSSNDMASSSTPVAPAQVTVPSGTTLVVYLNDGLSSETANQGDTFSGELGEAVYVNDRIAVPKNATVRGHVIEAKNAGKFKGQSSLSLELTSLEFGGHSYRINSDTWSKQGAARGKNTAAKVGGGAALGAIIGGIAGGGKGAAIGAGAGAAAGTGVQAVTRGEQVVLKPESMLQFALQGPVKVTPSSSESSNRQRLNAPSDKQD
jgi:hypothetical protein